MKKIIIPFLLVLLGAGCLFKENWTGFYYPDADNIGDESSWVIQLGFETLDECRDWVDVVSYGNKNFDYECGSGCRYDKTYGMNICKTTEQ